MCFITSDLGSLSAQKEIRRAFWQSGKAVINYGRRISRGRETHQLPEERSSWARVRGGQSRTLGRHAGKMEARDGMYFRSDETDPVRHRFATTHLGLEVEG